MAKRHLIRALLQFQFHIGAIRSGATRLVWQHIMEFQFHIGAIRSADEHIAQLVEKGVSIPYWCN